MVMTGKMDELANVPDSDREREIIIRQANSHFPFTAYCLEVIELPYGQFEFKLICMASAL